MPPAEQCRPSSGHDTPYQISSERICNRAIALGSLVSKALCSRAAHWTSRVRMIGRDGTKQAGDGGRLLRSFLLDKPLGQPLHLDL
jgi:hypothetical protein